MNRTEAKKYVEAYGIVDHYGDLVKRNIDIIRAFADGKEIEHLNSCFEWIVCSVFYFDDNPSTYRVKPDAKEMTIAEVEKALGFKVKIITEE